MDCLYEQLDCELESQARQYALDQLILTYIRGNRVFEAGCGTGTLLKLLLKQGFDAIGCDMSKFQCFRAKQRLQNDGFPSNRIHHLSLNDTTKWKQVFDTVICVDVLEHIKDDRQALHHLVLRLSPKGRLIIVVPALTQLWSRRDVAYGHYRRYTKNQLYTLLKSQPLKIRTIRYWNFLSSLIAWPAYRIGLDLKLDHLGTTKNFLLFPFQKLARWWLIHIERFSFFPFGMSLFTVAEKL